MTTIVPSTIMILWGIWFLVLLAVATAAEDNNENKKTMNQNNNNNNNKEWNANKENGSKEEYMSKANYGTYNKKAVVDIFAMEYLPIGHVRTDPIISQTCLSDHVHTFYGPPKVHPSVTYEELRSNDKIPHEATSGNVLENQSLYWHPSFYRTKKKEEEGGVKEIVEPDWTTIYYASENGKTRAFPEGFRMIAGPPGGLELVCYSDNLAPGYTSTTTTVEKNNETSHFPSEACEVMTASLVFPTCWDGQRHDSENHRDHVTYGVGLEDGNLKTFARAHTCPESHPVQLPQVLLFLRFVNYQGGNYEYELSNGNGIDWHGDYVMGWEKTFLQGIIDGTSECSSVLKDIPCESTRLRQISKNGGVGLTKSSTPSKSVPDIARFLQSARPPMVNTVCITEESINQIEMVPRGGCVGEVISTDSCDQPKLPADFLLRTNNDWQQDDAAASSAGGVITTTTTAMFGATISLVSTIFFWF